MVTDTVHSIDRGEVEDASLSVRDALGLLSSLRLPLQSVSVLGCTPSQLQALADGVRDAQADLDRFLTRVGVASAACAQAGLPGSKTAAETLLGDGQVRRSTARRDAARADVAAQLDKVGAALDRGSIGGEQLDSLARAARRLRPEQREHLNTDAVLLAAQAMPADAFDRAVQTQADRIRGDFGLADTKAKQKASSWRHWVDTRTGMGRISAAYDPERYESIVNAVEAQLSALAQRGDVAKDDNLAATAAHDLIVGGVAGIGGASGERVRQRPLLNVVVDADSLVRGFGQDTVAQTGDGHRLPPESVARLACDAVLQRVVLDERGIPVDVGRRYRTATDAQWQAIRAIYRSCAWSGCDRPLSWCQLHHIHEWEHGGATDLCNLIPLCNEHHHAVHEGGWRVQLADDRSLKLWRPNGELAATVGPNREPNQAGALTDVNAPP